MTEEIIVDGVNVAGCALFKDGKCINLTHLVHGEYINCNSMCDYGAYARKEQLKRLQAENEELRKENTELQEKFLDLNGKSYSYHKALEEIRELFCVGRTFCEGYFDNYNLSRADKTIKIINEVLE